LSKRRRAAKSPPRAKSAARAKPQRLRKRKPAAQTNEADPVSYGALSLHDLFQQQVRAMLDRTDLGEEQKQSALLAASCPCCGAGSFSFTAKLRPRR
jgi:hypothetical protein